MKRFKNGYLVILILLLVIYCEKNNNSSVKGTLEIHYTLSESPNEMVPSYQTVIWLADSAGVYLRSLLVSEYLSYGGFNDTTICPSWSRQADWNQVSTEMFDTVTQATPPCQAHVQTLDLTPLKLKSGKYRYYIQTHIQEDYNTLYWGKIEFGTHPANNVAQVQYTPVKYSAVSDVLNSVSAIFTPR